MRLAAGIPQIMVLALACAGGTAAAQAPEPFSTAYLDMQNLHVGYHMSAVFRLRDWDPNRCIRTSSGALSYQGELPPGIEFHQMDRIPFTGTPRQAGTWRGVLEMGFQCSEGADQTLYHRMIPVTFVVEP